MKTMQPTDRAQKAIDTLAEKGMDMSGAEIETIHTTACGMMDGRGCNCPSEIYLQTPAGLYTVDMNGKPWIVGRG